MGSNGYKQNPYEYFFVHNPSFIHSHMYRSGSIGDTFTDYERKHLAQIIQVMYDNRENQNWGETI